MSDAPDTAPDGATQAPAPAPQRRWGRWLLAGAAAATLAAPVVLWHSPGATAWALGQVPGLQVEGWQGSPGSGPMLAQRLRWESSAGRLEITELEAQRLEWRWQSGPGPNLALQLPELKIARLQWHSSSTPQPASPAPTSLRLPISLALPHLQIGTLQADSLPALQDLQAAMILGADAGQTHRLEHLQARTDRFRAEASGQLGADGPLPLQAQLRLDSLPGHPAWQAQAAAQGPLAQFDLTATLQGQAPSAADSAPGSSSSLPALQAQAHIRPFERWPLGDLSLRTQALDIAALLAGLPRTQLSGEVLLRTAGLDQAAQAQVSLSNALAGPWDQGLLPMRKLQGTLSGTPSPLSRLSGRELQLELGDARSAAGQISGQAEWQAASATTPHSRTALTLSLKQVTPAALDARAPAMTLSGPLSLTLDTPTDPATALGWTLDSRLEGSLHPRSGTVAHAAHLVSLSLEAKGQGSSLTVQQATLSAGSARAQLKGELSHQGEQWRWQAEGSLQEFDPAVWWPGAPDSAWRRGPHQLKAAFSSSGQAPLALLSQPEQLWRTGAAKLALTLEPSVLAGVPLQGQLNVTPASSGSQGQALSEALLQLAAGRNTLTAQAGATAGAPLRVSLKAPDLAGLAPLFKLYPGSAAWAPTEGEADFSLEALSEGPQVWSWRLSSQLKAIRTAALSLGAAQVTGQGRKGGSQEGQAELSVTAEKLLGQPWQIDRLQADLSGSLAQHRFSLNLNSPARPPAWFEQILGAKTGGGSQVSAQLQGQWQAAASGKARSPQGMAGRWTGQVLSLQGRSTDAASQAWLSAEKLGLSLDLDAAGRLQAADVQPGRVALPGTAIRWRTTSGAGRSKAKPGADWRPRSSPLRWPLCWHAPSLSWAGKAT